MKTPLIALALTVALAATAAAEQLTPPAAPTSPSTGLATTPKDIHRLNHEVLHADRERVRADKARLKLARATGDANGAREAQANLQDDMATWHSDRERIKH